MNFHTLGGRLLFSSKNGSTDQDLWVTDSTVFGTRLVRDINAGSGESDPGGKPVVYYFGPCTYPVSGFFELTGRLIFQANDGVHGNEIWETDGTESGTYLVKDINTGGGISYPSTSIRIGNSLVFTADDETVQGRGLWETEKTPSGKVLLRDIPLGSLTDE